MNFPHSEESEEKWMRKREALQALPEFKELLTAVLEADKHLCGDCGCKAPIGNCFKAMRDLLCNNDLTIRCQAVAK